MCLTVPLSDKPGIISTEGEAGPGSVGQIVCRAGRTRNPKDTISVRINFSRFHGDWDCNCFFDLLCVGYKMALSQEDF